MRQHPELSSAQLSSASHPENQALQSALNDRGIYCQLSAREAASIQHLSAVHVPGEERLEESVVQRRGARPAARRRPSAV